MAAIGNATKHGFLVREGDALERLGSVTRVAFDKTGTLTFGTPQVVGVETAEGVSKTELIETACAAEALSEHPLGKAVVRYYNSYNSLEDKKAAVATGENFRMYPGKGITAVV